MFNCQYIGPALNRIAAKDAKLAEQINEQGGFVTKAQVERLIQILPQEPILARCNIDRVVLPAMAILYKCAAVEAEANLAEALGQHAKNWVRDLSLPVQVGT